MDDILNLVYADHIRRIANDRQCNVNTAFDHVDDIAVIRDFLSELVNCNFPQGARNAYIGRLCRAEWRLNELKTNSWKERIAKMVTSMNKVEDRLHKSM